MKSCEAQQYSDQQHCDRCGLVWDMNDPDPPQCVSLEEINKRRGAEALYKILKDLDDESE